MSSVMAALDDSAIFRREGETFVPGPSAPGPWGKDKLHGGPVLGLIGRAIEAAAPDHDLLLSRLTVDMFRAVPRAPLRVAVRPIRQSARLWLLEASLFAGDEEYTRATALLLRETADDAAPAAQPRPSGPDGLPIEGLMRGFPPDPNFSARGFHIRVETRWVPRRAGDPLAIWFRLPIPLVAGEADTPLRQAIALSDFANAIASIAGRERAPEAAAYINTDATLYLSRRPVGEWFCIEEQSSIAERGISVTEAVLYDMRGPFARVLQARLAQSFKRA